MISRLFPIGALRHARGTRVCAIAAACATLLILTSGILALRSSLSIAAADEPLALPKLAEPYTLEVPPRVVPPIPPRLWLAEFSPDGKLLVTTAGWYSDQAPFGPSNPAENGELVLWDIAKRAPRYVVSEAAAVRSAAFSPDGKMLACCLFDGKVKLLDAATGKVTKVLGRHKALANAVSFSSDGKMLASCGFDQTVRLWDVKSGKSLKTLETECRRITYVTFSPDGKKLATTDWEAPNNAQIWDVEEGKVLRSLSHAQRVEAAAFSPDGAKLATTSWDLHVRVWNVANGEEVLHKETGGGSSVMFSPNGKLLVSSSFSDVTLTDFPEGGERWTVRNPEGVFAARFSPDGKTLAVAGRQSVRLHDVSDGTETAALKRTSDSAEELPAVRAVALSPDGTTLATAGDSGQVQLRDAVTGKLKQALKGFDDTVTSLAFNANGGLLAAASNDRKVKLWGVKGDAAKVTEKLTLPTKEWPAAVAFSPDGKILAVGGYDKLVRLLDPADGKELGVLPGHDAAVRALAFSADGKRLASGSGDDTIKLWNLETKTKIATLEGHTAAVRSVAFTPDGKTLVSGAEDGKVRFWDADGTARGSIDAHRDMVWTVAIVGKDTLVSGGADGQLILWDLGTKEQRQRLAAHTDALTSLAVSRDADYIVSGGLDRSIKIWRAREKTD